MGIQHPPTQRRQDAGAILQDADITRTVRNIARDIISSISPARNSSKAIPKSTRDTKTQTMEQKLYRNSNDHDGRISRDKNAKQITKIGKVVYLPQCYIAVAMDEISLAGLIEALSQGNHIEYFPTRRAID